MAKPSPSSPWRAFYGQRLLIGRRFNLWAADPQCHWCGRETVYATPLCSHGVKITPPDDLATIDHLDSRLTQRRGQVKGERTVLACLKCNQERGANECRAYPGHGERFDVVPQRDSLARQSASPPVAAASVYP